MSLHRWGQGALALPNPWNLKKNDVICCTATNFRIFGARSITCSLKTSKQQSNFCLRLLCDETLSTFLSVGDFTPSPPSEKFSAGAHGRCHAVRSLRPIFQAAYGQQLHATYAANTRQARSEKREAIFHRNTCLARYRARDGAR